MSTAATYLTVDIVNKDNNHLFVLKLEGLKVSWEWLEGDKDESNGV